MVEEEKHGETLNDDLVNKIMNELDERVFRKIEPQFDKTTTEVTTDIFDHK